MPKSTYPNEHCPQCDSHFYARRDHCFECGYPVKQAGTFNQGFKNATIVGGPIPAEGNSPQNDYTHPGQIIGRIEK